MSDDDGPLETLAGLVAVVTLPLGILAGIFVGGQAAGVVFVVGWLLLVPVLGYLDDHVGPESADTAPHDESRRDSTAHDDALQRLRERYAAGEIDEATFERRVERLLETEPRDTPPGAGPAVEPARGDEVVDDDTPGERRPDASDSERERE